MGSSLYLSGGVQSTSKLTKTVSTANSFAVGDVVRFDIPSNSYVKAQADNATNAEVVGVVEEANTSSFKVVYSGEIDLTSVSTLSGFSGPVLFLSNTVAGGLTANPPSAIGAVVKPLVVRNAATNQYVVTNFLGTQIGGSSTVAIDEIQPVGTIMPFAGSAIPDTWLACDGNSYAIASYPQLYAKLQNSSGDRAPAYGYVATLTGTNVSSVLSAGDYIQYKSDTGAWSGTSPLAGGASNAALLATVLSVTSTTAVVQVVPIYSSTTKNFTISNTIFGGGGFVGTETGTGNYRAYTSGSAFKAVSLTITGTAITHFNTPDLRGRFALGVNTSTLPTTGDLESDVTNNSAISGIYSLGSEGGQESTIAGTGVATGTNAYVTSTAASGGLIANMPPYTVVRYIIKASPYTRAAIIDGLDVPYNQLLVSDLRDGSLNPSGNGTDLLFKTNSGVGGTERMRLSNDGRLGIGMSPAISNQMLAVSKDANANTRISVYNASTGTSALASLHLNNNVTNGYVAVYGNNASSHANMTSLENDTNGGGLLLYSGSANGPILFKVGGGTERMRLTGLGNLGIGTSTPGFTLDVFGTARISDNTVIGGTLAVGTSVLSNAKLKVSEASTATDISSGTCPLVVVNPNQTANNWTRIQLVDNDNASGGVLLGARCVSHTTSPKRYQFHINVQGTDGQLNRLSIIENGMVGIAYSAPSYRLDVLESTASDSALRVTTGGSNSLINFKDAGTGTQSQVGCNGNDLVFRTGNSERLRITSTGVGVSSIWIPEFRNISWDRQVDSVTGNAALSDAVTAPGTSTERYTVITLATGYSYSTGDGLLYFDKYTNIPGGASVVFNQAVDVYSINGNTTGRAIGGRGWRKTAVSMWFRTQ